MPLPGVGPRAADGGGGGGRTPYAWIGGDLNPGIVSREGVWVRESRHSVPARVHRMILRLASRIDGVDRYKSIKKSARIV